MSYIGNTAQNQSFAPQVDFFSGNGVTTAFTLSRTPQSVYAITVVIANVPQNPSDAFTLSGNTITFTSAPPSGTNNIYVSYVSPNTQVVQPGQGTVGTAALVDSSVTTAKIADANVTGTKLENSGVTAGTYGSASAIPALTIDAKGRVTSATTNSFSSAYVGGQGQTFTGNGTFTIPTGVTAVKVTVVAGGASGGPGSQLVCTGVGAGGGGGAGGAAIQFFTGLTPGNTLAVTVGGAAQASSVASGTQTITTVSATAGSAGGSASNGLGIGGLGGIGSGGAMNIRGAPGSNGITSLNSVASQAAGGNGGSSIFGGGANGRAGSGVGVAASAYGGGGGGGVFTSGSGGNAGGAGSAGVVVFEW